MVRVGSRQASENTLLNSGLRAYDHSVGILRVEGKVEGYLASVVLQTSLPAGKPWVWFVVVWANGVKEPSFEDYGPGWATVRELDAGFLQHYGPSVIKKSRFFGGVSYKRGAPCRFDFERLSVQAATVKWQELGLKDSDF